MKHVLAITLLFVPGLALAQTCDYYPLNTCAQNILGKKTFYDGISVPGGITTDGGAAISGPVTINGNLTVNGDAGVAGNKAVFGSIAVSGDAGISGSVAIGSASTIQGSTIATAANGYAGGNACVFQQAQQLGASGSHGTRGVGLITQHPLVSGSTAAIYWTGASVNGDGGSLVLYLKDVSANRVLLITDGGCAAVGDISLRGTLDGGADAGDLLGLYVESGGCSGDVPGGSLCVSW